MARYVFGEYAEKYVESVKGVYSPGTMLTLVRRFKRMEREFIQLQKDKVVKSISPNTMGIEDVKEFLIYRKNKGIGNSELGHDISAITNLLSYVNNPAAVMCLIKYPFLKPKGTRRKLDPMDDYTFNAIIKKSREINMENWKLVRAYTLVLLALSIGTRSEEVRLMEVGDIKARHDGWIISVIHVKGERTYGQPRDIPVQASLKRMLEAYLPLREQFLKDHNLMTKALFPSSYSDDGFLAANTLRKIKSFVEKDVGVNFDFRTCRRTFGQKYVDADLDIESVSVLMGHCSTQTTERYYCRKSNKEAIMKARKKADW